MERIPVQWWQAFVVFRESADMTEAAARLGLTQPALSKQLKSLQSRLPQPLLRSEGKRRVPTEYGEALYRELRGRFAGLEEDVRDIGLRHAQSAPPRIRIHARREVLDRLIRALRTPTCLVLNEAGHEQIAKAIAERATDIAVDHRAPDSEQWIARPLFQESFEFWIPKSLLARRPSGEGLEILQELPVLAYRERDELLEQAARERRLDPRRLRVAGVTGNYASLREWVRAGRGWAVLPAYLADEEGGCWRLPIPARTLPSREFFAIYRREHAKARWLRETLTEIHAAFKP